MKRFILFAVILALLLTVACSNSTFSQSESFPTENETIYSNNEYMECGDTVYFSNGEKIYSFDGKECKVIVTGSQSAPLFFYIEGSKLLYMTQYESKIFVRDINSLTDANAEKSFGRLYMDRITIQPYNNAPIGMKFYDVFNYSTFLAAEGHVFYKGKDGKLHRATVDGANDRVISNIDVDSLTYSRGYIYFTCQSSDKVNLYRIRTDGSGQKKLTKKPIDSYLIMQNGDLYYIISDQESGKYSYSINKVDMDTLNMIKIKQDYWLYDNIGIDGDYIYITGTGETSENIEIQRIPLGGGTTETIYKPENNDIEMHDFPPVLVGDYIYFYMERELYRIRKDGTDLTEIGVSCAYLDQRGV